MNGTCEDCRARGINWDSATEYGTCYECHRPLTQQPEERTVQDGGFGASVREYINARKGRTWRT